MNELLQSQCSQEYFHVIFAGVKGGGRYLTGLRNYIGRKGFVISSLSTRAGLKWGEYRLSTHYRNLAQQLVDRAQDQVIRIYAHSLGGVEVLDLMKALAERKDLPQKTLEVILISPPGIGQRGLRGLGKVGLRLRRVIQNVGLYDQYHFFPLPSENDVQGAEQRRFVLDTVLPRIIPGLSNRLKIIRELEIIDAELCFLKEHPDLRKAYEGCYLRRRHLILKSLIEKVFSGAHIEEAKHGETLQYYREYGTDIASRLSYLPVALFFAFRAIKTLYQGIDKRIVETFEYCQKQVVAVKLGVAILGKDELVVDRDYDNLLKLTQPRNIGITKHFFSDVEHASVAHRWPVIDALEAIRFGI